MHDHEEVDMRSVTTSYALTACLVAGFAFSTTQARAGVMSTSRSETVAGPSIVEEVHYRYWHRHHYWHRHYGHWRPHRYYRYAYYPRYYYPRYYGYYGYNPAGALAGAAVGLATAPLWALGGLGWGWGYPYYW